MNVLIVDDHPTNRKLLRASLTAEGYTISEAADGLQALKVLASEPIDVVISDVLMPNMDGYRLCAEIRRCDTCDATPFIFYTSTYTDHSEEKLALEFGADRFLRKPAPIAVLKRTIEESVAQRRAPDSKPAPVGQELDVMKEYNHALIRKLEKRNDELSARTEALHASESRLRAVFEAGPDCVQVVGRDGRTIEINRAGLEIFEADALEEIAGHAIKEFVVADYLEAFDACAEAVWRGEKSCVEFEIAGLRGRKRWLEMHAAPLLNVNGEIVALLAVTRDNTARKELEARIVQAQKMEVVGQLAGGIAHDFNNMLGIVMGYSELVLGELSSASPLHQYVQTIFHTAERAAGLTRQLLIFSRKQALQPRVLDLSELIAAIDPMLRRLIGENIKLATVPEVELGRIEADPGQIEQVVMNLTVNARDAMPNGGAITISTSNATIGQDESAEREMAPGDYVVLSVADNGWGMTDEVKARIFEGFFTTKPAGQGTGLGLATCQSIVNQWGGRIGVESAPGSGTTFKIYLPRVTRDADSIGTGGQSGALPRGNETVLVVEDEQGLRDLAGSVLQRQGYAVLKAANGQEALRIVRHRRGAGIDLVVTDMIMPEMGGKVMAEWLQATNPEIKVLFTSGYTECGLDGALDAGIEFLQKPYTPSVLVRKVRAVMDGGTKNAVPCEAHQTTAGIL